MAIRAAVQLAVSLSAEKGMDVCVIDLDGGDIRRLTEGVGWDRFPAWSPDGTQIAFTSNRPAGDGPRSERVWVVDAEGSQPVPIAKGMGATWSPDGSQLAFFDYRPHESHIYVANADGSGERRVTSGNFNHEGPAWSPDGTRIAFASPDRGPYRLYAMSSEGSALERLTTDDDFERFPAWSPEGTRIAYTKGHGPREEIWVLDLDDHSRTRITESPGYASLPAWSPDGDSIAFETVSTQGEAEIHVVHRGGSGRRRLALGSNPAFRPR